MNYSITFAPHSPVGSLLAKNTWTDWKLIPDSPPMVQPPELETNYVDIPGRAAGPIDLTGIAVNKTYKRITGSWTFFREITSKTDRLTIYNTLRTFFTGKIMRITFTDDDPAHYFVGRITVAPPRAIQNPMSITLGFDLEPVRYNTSNDAIDTTWIT